MIKNYFKIAWRNLTRQRLYSFINISGLAIGLAVCMIIMLYVAHEHSYDRFHKNSDRIFTLHAQMKMDGNTTDREFMSYATGSMIKDALPGVEGYMRYFKYFLPVTVNNASSPQTQFTEEKLLFADADFFNFFSFKLIAGQATNVLNKPFSVVISKDIAKKYFGDENPVGKTLTIKTERLYNYLVTGVAENSPSNSSIDFNFVASAISLNTIKSEFPYFGPPRLGPGIFNTYLLLKNPGDKNKIMRSIQSMVKTVPNGPRLTFSLPLLTDSHLKNNTGDISNTKYLEIFPIVAVLILLLVLVNFMSLSTARATLRAKEVGVRKISGAGRNAIAVQFYIESAVFTTVSFVLGYLLCYAFKTWFLNVLQLKIDNEFLYSPIILMLLGALLLITILIAGSYPSVVLSSFKPAITLKGKTSKQAAGAAVRKVFTTLQFAISVGLIICGIIIDRQLYYFRHTNSGINRDNVVMINIPGDMGKKYQALKSDVKILAGVSSVATSNYSLFNIYDTFTIKGKTSDEDIALLGQAVDHNFIKTLGLQWKVPPSAEIGSNDPAHPKIILNEAAVEKLHLPANPVGSIIPSNNIRVMGVVKNFNFKSMQYAIEPFGVFVVPDSVTWGMPGCCLYAKIKPGANLPTLINGIQDIYKKYDDKTPFSYSFLDDVFNEQYKAEDRLASIFSVFTVITVVLAALGLFGLAAFTIEQRTKEIGIRKILGASLSAITGMLSRDFLKLVLLSIIIASPLAWWAMDKWLQNFAYRITIQWWVFASAGLLAVVVAIMTISYHAIKASIANPVDSLRNE